MSWIDDAKRTPVAVAAERLGFKVGRSPSADHCACPACRAERRHPSRGDTRGAVGMPHDDGYWKCFECEQGGDVVDFLAFALRGSRLRDLSKEHRSEVREWFGGGGGSRHFNNVRAALPPAAPVSPTYLPSEQLAAFWRRCGRVDGCRECAEYLHGRGINPVAVAERDLARSLPRAPGLPPWAACGKRSWLESHHRVVVPLFDALGTMRSVLARCVEREPRIKSISAQGYRRAGLVMADALARQILITGARPPWWTSGHPLTIGIAEGEIDFLSAALNDSDVDPYAPGVLGIVSGSWSERVAARVPDGAVIGILTDQDGDGEKYAARIFDSFAGRAVQIKRFRPLSSHLQAT